MQVVNNKHVRKRVLSKFLPDRDLLTLTGKVKIEIDVKLVENGVHNNVYPSGAI